MAALFFGPPVPLVLLSLCSLLPAINAINTLPKQIPLANVTRKIHYEGERRDKGENERIKDKWGERKAVLSLDTEGYKGKEGRPACVEN